MDALEDGDVAEDVDNIEDGDNEELFRLALLNLAGFCCSCHTLKSLLVFV